MALQLKYLGGRHGGCHTPPAIDTSGQKGLVPLSHSSGFLRLDNYCNLQGESGGTAVVEAFRCLVCRKIHVGCDCDHKCFVRELAAAAAAEKLAPCAASLQVEMG